MTKKANKSGGGTIRTGMSGWTYVPWRGVFYPKGLPQSRELEYASSRLTSIEINGTFYGLQRPTSYAAWHEQTPADFVFSIKGSRFITHIRRLRDIQTPLANFLLSGLLRLNEKLGPILWQFPPNFKYSPDLFEAFLEMLPHSTQDATKLVKHTDERMKGRLWAETDRDRPMRHAVEIRHQSFEVLEFVRLLRKHGVALVIADTAGKWPMLHDVTGDFVYVRLHGAEELYATGYSEAALNEWASKIRVWCKGGDAAGARRIGPAARKAAKRDVFVYFDNDVKVRAPFDAARLAEILGVCENRLEDRRSLG
jgi:uncharacterized protein YecE (DUF72 family)